MSELSERPLAPMLIEWTAKRSGAGMVLFGINALDIKAGNRDMRLQAHELRPFGTSGMVVALDKSGNTVAFLNLLRERDVL